jgi:3-oxoacid CoA-transferase subunit B
MAITSTLASASRLVANYVPQGISVTLQSENGMLGIGPFPYEARLIPTLSTRANKPSRRFPPAAFSPAPTALP